MKLSIRNQRIRQMCKAGETYQAIGDKYGITRERVRQVLERSGIRSVFVTMNEAARKNQNVIAQAFLSGIRISTLAIAHDVSESFLRKLLHRVLGPGRLAWKIKVEMPYQCKQCTKTFTRPTDPKKKNRYQKLKLCGRECEKEFDRIRKNAWYHRKGA